MVNIILNFPTIAKEVVWVVGILLTNDIHLKLLKVKIHRYNKIWGTILQLSKIHNFELFFITIIAPTINVEDNWSNVAYLLSSVTYYFTQNKTEDTNLLLIILAFG